MSQTETLRYGQHAELTIDFDQRAAVEHCGQPKGAGFDDPVAAVMASLVAPLDFPALAEATVPGDKVVIAVGATVPELDLVIEGILQTLVDSGVSPDNITVLLASDDPIELAALGANSWRDSVQVSASRSA